jgi:phosphatidylserine decarboxylase
MIFCSGGGFLITRYGYDVVFIIGGIVAAAIVLSVLFIHSPYIKYPVTGIFFFLFLFTLYFFRDPERTIPEDVNVVLSPADGKLVLIKELDTDDFLDSPAIQMSIFLSPLDVHVNRIPWGGTVKFVRYIKGDYMVAYDHKASEKNERTEIGVEGNGRRIVFKQIVGSIARRIVCPLHEGDEVKKGERFGMIKFGSRMDIILPRDVTVKVSVGQRVVGGETILAVLPD